MAKQAKKKDIEKKIKIQTESDEKVKNTDTEKESPEAPLSELEKSRQEAADNYDKFLRVAAEFDNYKKRVARERTDFIKFGNEALVKDMLPIVDSLDRALEHSSDGFEEFEAFISGFKLIQEQLLGCLEKHGVERIQSVGMDFDPNIHEAMLQIESKELGENKIVEEFEKGYLLNGRLLRPAKVSVSKSVKKAEE